VRSAVLAPERAAAVLEGPLGMTPVLVEPWHGLALDLPAPLSQSLAGAVACLTGGRA